MPCAHGSSTRPARSAEPRCGWSNDRCPSLPPARCSCACGAAASVEPTCTSPKATCRRAATASCRDTRSSGSSTRSAPIRAGSRWVTASGSPGSAAPAAAAGGAAAGRRTCVSSRRSPAGTPTAATPNTPWSPEAFAYRLPDGGRRARRSTAALRGNRRVPGAPTRRAAPGGRLGIYGFGASAHRHGAIAQGATVHVLTRAAEARRLRSTSARPGGGDATHHPNHSTPPCSSPRRASSSRSRCARSTRAAPSPWRASTSATSPRSPARAVPREAAPQRHRQHPGRRRGVPSAGGPAAHPADDDAAPLGRSRSGAGRPGRRPDHRRRRPARRAAVWGAPADVGWKPATPTAGVGP